MCLHPPQAPPRTALPKLSCSLHHCKSLSKPCLNMMNGFLQRTRAVSPDLDPYIISTPEPQSLRLYYLFFNESLSFGTVLFIPSFYLSLIECQCPFTIIGAVGKDPIRRHILPQDVVPDAPTQDHWEPIWGRRKSGFKRRIVQDIPEPAKTFVFGHFLCQPPKMPLKEEATDCPTKTKRRKKEEVGLGTGEGDVTLWMTKKGIRDWILIDLLAVRSIPLHLRSLA
ncbi:uncharacterized protein LOC123822739 [Phyllostomus hastatus]|uniref:uncharacterized protein LOC123822739 n=1 Tax=Phyllostomus hastatus TaxID=9423 RepID=UPI001E682DFC|nr:uncharacterized protein LOC123822739 [Phyllostomus hastatus]